MRKIIGIGETILDIIFRKDANGEWQPQKSVAGGSTFNSIITLGRLGMNTALVTELGDDQVGKEIIEFMHKYNISTNYIDIYNSKDGKTPISLAFLDENNNANYTFYHQFPADRLNVVMPLINEGDIIIFGSYFSVNPVLRHRIIEILDFAKTRKAIVYYDPNFRKAHAHKAMMLMPSIIENLEYANIVRGSDEDFETLYKLNDPEKIYIDKIKFYCPNFIYTRGGQGIEFYCEQGHRHFDAPSIGKPISTIGAGDTFNAGIIFGLIRQNVTLDNLNKLTLDEWAPILQYALNFSSQVCMSQENYLPEEIAAQYK
ncbi:MAG: carbohydrate kinase [Bacteroidaceae bacterium]|nr:carbohydrate kinase [Bacteroidaceae bacterium]